MTRTPLDVGYEDLPDLLPVFPLSGVLLLPRGRLPLNIFEPRYLNMTVDALAAPSRLIGMIQPKVPENEMREPPLYDVGCAGRITSFSETEDGRCLITLTGMIRFRIQAEVPGDRGYRRVTPAWAPFKGDLDDSQAVKLDRPRLLGSLKDFFKLHGIAANWDAIEQTPDDRLVTSLAMICPFEPPEKQALLEAEDLGRRAELMITLIDMALLEQNGGESARH